MGITRIKEDTDMALLGRRLNLLPLSLAAPLPLPPPFLFSTTAMQRPHPLVTLFVTQAWRGGQIL